VPLAEARLDTAGRITRVTENRASYMITQLLQPVEHARSAMPVRTMLRCHTSSQRLLMVSASAPPMVGGLETHIGEVGHGWRRRVSM
jgi:hypothetical protein